ncbi:MAG TPA: branched-chain amino acid ABC transporter permease [Spirochaetales bacterium]|nr:branched-chain amino acid ABC transporter permease [Spirochaetales bacterium]HRY55156.1 branched-chain amino acid ABC transporter permease [Spirochaetia bacterium]HRZ64575.1 branched-chain amino acid ABC transporter permease [Spirochaetia bacterium]
MTKRARSDLAWLAFAAALAFLPAIGLVGPGFGSHVLVQILLTAAMAQAWNLVGGYAGQVSYGHSVFFGIGAYGAALAVCELESTPWPGALAGAALAAVVAVLIGLPTFKLKGHYFAIATFALVEVANRLFMMWDAVGGALGLDYPILKDSLANFTWSKSKVGYYYGALAIALLVFGLVRRLERARFGFYLRAVREGQDTAESLGVDSSRVKLAAMALSAALSALCGSFFAQYNYRVDPGMVMSLDMSMRFVLVAILGGIGSFAGPLLGAAVLVPLQEYSRAYLAKLGPGVDLVIFGLVIVLMMEFQPKGILGILESARAALRRGRGER